MPVNLRQLDYIACRPMIMWKWDTDPTEDSIVRQLEAVAELGLGGVCVEPIPDQFRPGDFPRRMKIDYLGEEFFRLYRSAVEKAAQLGLTVWVYDEGGWPSGQACGKVLQDHGELEGQSLVHEAGRFIRVRTGRADPLKAEATRLFIELTHERYFRAVGKFFGGAIEAVFSDEVSVPGQVGSERIPWTDDMPEQFARRMGYELEPVMGLLFEGCPSCRATRARVLEVRLDFTRVWNDLLIERCLGPQQAWCGEHGVLFTGHLGGDHDIRRHPPCAGDYFAAMQVFDAPGIDTIWRQIWRGMGARSPVQRPTNQRCGLTRPHSAVGGMSPS